MKGTEELKSLPYVTEMRTRCLSVAQTITLERSPDVLWPYLTNTDMINQATGLKPIQHQYKPDVHGGTLLHVEIREQGIRFVYKELPFEWRQPRQFSVERIFSKGPVEYLRFECQLEETAPGKSQITASIYFVSKFFPPLVRVMMKKNLDKIVAMYNQLCDRIPSQQATPMKAFFADPQLHREQIDKIYVRWKDLSKEPEIPRAIAEFFYTAPDRYVNRMRPFEIANMYQLNQLQTLCFFLRATQAGYMNLSWDLLCPSCLGDKSKAKTLNEVTNQGHCDACLIDYEVDFDRNVELTFKPAAKWREAHDYAFCAGSPANTTHVAAQFNIWPGQKLEPVLELTPGSYRFASVSIPKPLDFQVVESGGLDKFELSLSDYFLHQEALCFSKKVALQLENLTEYLRTIKVERLTWKENVVTAAFVTTLQDFRHMFSSEVLRPGIQLAISNAVILFTDLKDSTQMYETYGDAPSFSLVQDHFDILFEQIQIYQGAVIKTIGDAVMAAFHDPLAAMQASIDIQKQFKTWNAQNPPERQAIVKIGLHQGPCLVLNLNNNLDYFGATVNKAARVQGHSVGDDIIFSEEINQEESIQDCLTDYQPEAFDANLKGIEGNHRLYRIIPA